MTKKRATPTRKTERSAAEVEAGLSNMLWLATDREVRIAKRAPGDPSPACWLPAVGTRKGEPRMTDAECFEILERITVLSQRNPDARIYVPQLSNDDPAYMRAYRKRLGAVDPQAVYLLRFDVDVRRELLALRLVAAVRDRLGGAAVAADKSEATKIESIKHEILLLRARAESIDDQEHLDAFEREVEQIAEGI